jgi:hypothetical protein
MNLINKLPIKNNLANQVVCLLIIATAVLMIGYLCGKFIYYLSV